MNLEVINTGTELLLGSTLNTHVGFLGAQLLPLGLRISRQLAIPDGPAIRDAVRETIGRAEIVLVTGGLGPTSDDITRELTAELLGLPLHEDPEVSETIRRVLEGKSREFNDASRRQAMVPAGATVLPNANGTAPGLYLPPLPVPGFPDGTRSPHLFLLPGPPREMHPMFTDSALPILRRICEGRTVERAIRNFRLTGVGETQVAAAVEAPLLSLGDIELGYCARMADLTVRVLGTPAQLAAAESILSAEFPANYYSGADQSIEEVVVDLLTRLGATVSAAESCTGGLLAHRLTNVPGASAVLHRSYVTYSNDAKSALLGVPEDLLAAHGAVSAEVAESMATGCLNQSGATHALALTGIAGPGGGSEAKPTGTVFIALASRTGGSTVVSRRCFPYERETFKWAATQTALDLLRRRLIRMI